MVHKLYQHLPKLDNHMKEHVIYQEYDQYQSISNLYSVDLLLQSIYHQRIEVQLRSLILLLGLVILLLKRLRNRSFLTMSFSQVFELYIFKGWL